MNNRKRKLQEERRTRLPNETLLDVFRCLPRVALDILQLTSTRFSAIVTASEWTELALRSIAKVTIGKSYRCAFCPIVASTIVL